MYDNSNVWTGPGREAIGSGENVGTPACITSDSDAVNYFQGPV